MALVVGVAYYKKNAASNITTVLCFHFTKAFDTVNRELLWEVTEVLSKFGCTPRYLTILRE